MNIYKQTALITQELEILVEDDFPYFYVGKNMFGKFVLGSMADYDENNGEKLFLHIIAEEETLLNHFKGNISYLSVMKKAQFVYEVRENNMGDEKKVSLITFSQIPNNILPEKTSFYLLDIPNCFNELEKVVQTKKQTINGEFHTYKPQKFTEPHKNTYKNDTVSHQLFEVQTA